MKRRRIVVAQIRRRFHLDDQYSRSRMCTSNVRDDFAQVLLHGGDGLAFVTVSAATVVSSALGLLHAAASARVAAISHVVQCPQTSFIIVMLVARHLTKQYRSGEHELTVLRDVNFSLPQGTFVAIVGPSGSGKTTLLGLLAGLDTPSSGTVLLDDSDLSALDEDARARLRGEKVGFVFQSFQLIPTLTALENVQVPLELRGDSGADVRARELLRRLWLGDRDRKST